MKNRKPSTSYLHKIIEDDIQKRIRGKDRHIFRNHEYKHNGDHEADILLLNYKRNYAYAIEVKTTNHKKARRHAYKQLDADESYIKDKWNINRVYKFYVHKSNRSQTKKGKLYEIHLI